MSDMSKERDPDELVELDIEPEQAIKEILDNEESDDESGADDD
jgi:hypothetical protein